MKFYHFYLVISSIFVYFCVEALPGKQPAKWLCVYSHIPVEKLLATKAELMVLDPDVYTSNEINRLNVAGVKVLAYLSVGEAEKYRSYFSKLAEINLIIGENPHWLGNYPVNFWDSRWKDLLIKYSEKILNKGFDGLFVDVVDVWQNFPESEQPIRKKQMENLLIELARYMLNHDSKYWPIIQNSHELLENQSLQKLTTGINQESLFATWKETEIDPDWQKYKISALKNLRCQGKIVTLIEYTRKPIDMARIKMKAAIYGFTPYFTVKELDRIFRD